MALDNGRVGRIIKTDRHVRTTTPEAPFVELNAEGGGRYRIWADNGGDLRIHSVGENANDTAGLIVPTTRGAD